MRRPLLVLALIVLLAPQVAAAEPPVPLDATFEAQDTLNVGPELSADARECLQGLVWPAAAFRVHCEAPRPRCGDLLLRFPSPIVTGNAANDLVAIEWYAARDADKRPIAAPAVVVVHESGSGMTVGRMFARGLQVQGLHAFMIQLPYYGERRAQGKRPPKSDLVAVIRQAIADVRRARDAVAALPLVEAEQIALQGTSLGGFVAATTAGIDDGFSSVFVMLAGGDLFDVIQHGERDTARAREELAAAGLSGAELKTMLAAIEPLRLAHRLDPGRTWLYSGRYDNVVPLKNANLLADAARLDDSHHICMPVDHYTGIVFLPYLLTQVREKTVLTE